MILGETCACAERLLEHRRVQAFGEVDEGGPGRRVVRARTDHERRGRSFVEESSQLVDCGRIGCRRAQHAPRRCHFPIFVDRRRPVVHGDDHDRGTARCLRLVPGAIDASGYLLRAQGMVDPHRVVARQPLEPAGEERLEHEMAAVLLADDDDQGRAIDARSCDRADRVAQPSGRVQDRKRRLPATEREPRRKRDHGPLVQPEHEPEVLRQAREKRDLGRTGIGEQRRELPPTKDVERRLANRLRHAGSRLSPRLPPPLRRSSAASPTAAPVSAHCPRP